jgi:deoxyribonuclease-4
MSIAGGLAQALHRGQAVGCSIVQLFLKNQVRWAAKRLGPGEIAEFKRAQTETSIRTVFAHASYLINLCSPAEAEWEHSLNALVDELERAEALGLPFVIVHPGSHKGEGFQAGLERISRALQELERQTRGYDVRLLLENTAGAGNTVGARFEELQAILERASAPERFGVCLDTCHLFAAGYDIRTQGGYEATIEDLDRQIGVSRVHAWHLNDAKKGLGSGLDRHEHIGEGQIGLEAFRALLNDPRFASRPMSLETPKEGDWDQKNLATLRGLRRRAKPSAK